MDDASLGCSSMTASAFEENRAAIHGCLFFACLVASGFQRLDWPWHLVLPVLVYGGIVFAFAPLRRTFPKLAIGRLGGAPLACSAALALATTFVLLVFQSLVRPDVKDLAATLPIDWFGNLPLAGVCFSVVNAALEELIFRGILWDLVADEWSERIAFVVTSFLFGLGHFQGYPPGPIGAIMAGLYGVSLGAIRWWTGGFGLATACHVGADATIFWILSTTGAFDVS